jgi:hypothetical protein
VRIKNRETCDSVETSMILNTGYEAAGPRVLLPKSLAKKLGIKLGGKIVEAKSSLGSGRLIDAGVKVLIETDYGVAEAEVRIPEAETELIANDALIEELGIEIIRAGEGVYRFSGDSTERKSVPPEFWD